MTVVHSILNGGTWEGKSNDTVFGKMLVAA